METSLPAPGSVQHIEVQDSTIMCAVDEPSIPAAPGTSDLIPFGVVHLVNPASGTSIPIKVLDSSSLTFI